MSQKSGVSRAALCMSKVMVPSVTRSPIELFWTAKNTKWWETKQLEIYTKMGETTSAFLLVIPCTPLYTRIHLEIPRPSHKSSGYNWCHLLVLCLPIQTCSAQVGSAEVVAGLDETSEPVPVYSLCRLLLLRCCSTSTSWFAHSKAFRLVAAPVALFHLSDL